jgi:subtilisin family serine protease
MRNKLLSTRNLLFFLAIVLMFQILSYHQTASAAKFQNGEKPPVAFQNHEIAFVPGEVVVKLAKNKSVEDFRNEESFRLYDSQVLSNGFRRLWIDGDVLEACNELKKDQSVIVAEPNYIRYLQVTPNDPLFSRQDNLKLSAAEIAWNIETGDSDVIVAVIDTGVDKQHPDLIANLLPGKSFFQSDTDESDDSGHGTAVSGVVAASANNNLGVSGSAWNVKILPLRACGGPTLTCSVVDEAEAIEEAIVQGADIINLSLGGVGKSIIEEEAVNNAWNAGIVLIAAAGNGNPGLLGKVGNPENEGFINYPAGYANVIGVGSVDYPPNGDLSQVQKSTFANYGDAVSVTAVGNDVVTTAPSVEVDYLIFDKKADYGQIDGTSFSTPLVSGMAALIKSHFPNITNTELRSRIETSAVDVGPTGWDDEFGYGVVNFQRALLGSTHASNTAFNMGVTTNPVLNDDVIVIVKVKVAIIGDPSVVYSYWEDGQLKSGVVTLTPIPDLTSVWSGNIRTSFSGNITLKLNGTGPGGNLPELQTEYFKGEN